MATINRNFDPILPVLDCNPATQESRKKRRNCYEKFDKTKKYRHIIERKQIKHGRRGNNDRVKFALFLKYLIHHLQVTDPQKYKKAKQVRLLAQMFQFYNDACLRLIFEQLLTHVPLLYSDCS